MESSVPVGPSWERLGGVLAASWGDLEASGRVLVSPSPTAGLGVNDNTRQRSATLGNIPPKSPFSTT